MSAAKLCRKPRKAIAREGCRAWWYENYYGIDVFIQNESGATRRCQITKRQLQSYMRKMKS